MNIDNQPVPDSIVAVWRSAVADLDDAALRALAKVHRELSIGFRPNKTDPAVLRTRAMSAFERFHELPEAYLAALREATLANPLLSVLSQEAVDALAPQLLRCFGAGLTLASMLLDDRAPVRTKAFELLQAWDGAEPDDEDACAASRELTETLAPFLKRIGRLLPQAAAPASPPVEAPPRIEPRPQRDRQLLIDLRDKRHEANRLRRDLDAAIRDREQLTSQVSALARSLAVVTDERDAIAAELAALRGDVQGRVDAIVARQLDARLLPWLRPAEALRSAVDDTPDAGLLAAADQLLRRQAEVDLRHGLRSRLRDELERCEAARARLLAAQADALNPLRELSQLARRLEQRAIQLRNLLGESSPATTPGDHALAALEREIASAPTLEALTALRQSMEAAAPLGLLSDDALQRGHAAIRSAASRLYAKAGAGQRPQHQALAGLPLFSMLASLARGEPCTLVVDGHNVLFGLPELFREHHENGAPRARARKMLEHRLVTLARRHPELRIHVWFDGEQLSDHSASEQVRVHFSGGTGADRADRRIVEFLAHLETKEDRPRAVVTGDRAIALAAQVTGAMTMVPRELAVWME